MGRTCKKSFVKILGLLLCVASISGCDGKAEELSTGDYLGDPVIGDGGGTRTDGSDQGQIYTVTKIVEATNEISEWTDAGLPFIAPRRSLGVAAIDSQWPFKFLYTYPPNNYSLGDARLLLVTARDSSDTEAIFIDGVFTGRPPATMVSGTSPNILYRNYSCPTCTGGATPSATPNTYFMDWSLTHYKIGLPNTFDLNITDLLTSTPLTPKNILDDGLLRVVTGDDARAYSDDVTTSRPLLVMQGFTISKTPLTCTTSPVYKLTNSYIHNDGNSITQPAFTGTVLTPVNSWSTAYTTMRSVEFFYDPRLPVLSSYTNLNITTAHITLRIKRANTSAVAMVINGIGIDQDGFNRSGATSAIESWSADTTARSYWNTWVNSIPATGIDTTVTLNLITLLGADKVKELLLQGKLNFAFAGSIASVFGSGNTSTRTYGVAVNGPDLVLQGNYTAEICDVPNNPSSPLDGSSGAPTSCVTDTASPVASSIQVTSITATTARVQWLTNENSTTQVGYGISAPDTLTPVNSARVTFHSVDLTGLQPYKYYQYNVKSTDGCGNSLTSAPRSFRTLR